MRKVLIALLLISSVLLLTAMLSGCGGSNALNPTPTATTQFAFIRESGFLTAARAATLPRSHIQAHAVKVPRRPTYRAAMVPLASGIENGTDSIVVMKNDGTGEQVIADQAGWFYKVQMSLDGTKAVFVADDMAGYEQVYVASSTNPTTAIQLTTGTQDYYGAQLSPNGSTAIYINDYTDPYQAEMVATTGTGTPTRLNVPAGYCVHDATFTPDGKTIVFVGHTDASESDGLYSVSVSGGTPTRLTNLWDYAPSVTSDGKTIVFERWTGEGVDIFAMPIAGEIATGKAATRLTTDGRSFDPLVVDNKIVYVSSADVDGDGDTDIFAMNLDGTGQGQLTALDNDRYEYFDYWTWWD